ncbi:tripartite tricarboxylate transporter substrate binding protein [Bordetella sp. BOR01]|uniref:Bug family tripartite tricarboxylate transporter substrate binding protein n=1 Tax=Bordetella sp. BOR01 TaxID=2854779 RepID=UPI001C456D72|nr:tripartite tricarboxylate transporter substrate binding protein [Bordetella sp. BOR01]MBV7482614.1 tripartite tricarboxylate transporter substrate binding protein [Bordetella sp. BOR01]
MNHTKLALTRFALPAMLALGAALQPAHGQQYPTKPITFIVPYAAGGSSDTRSRQLAQRLATHFGQAVVVENRPGASGNIGTDAIARATPDGYVIGLGNFAPMAINAALYQHLSYDPARITKVAPLEKGPLVLAVAASSPYSTLPEFLAYAKARRGEIDYASTGAGGASHLVAELFKREAGIDAVHVPYRGGAPAINDLIGGNVDFMMDLASLFMPHAGGADPKIKILAVTSEQRLPALPDVPTFREQGLPDMVASNWFGVIGPAGLPDDIVSKLNSAVGQVVKDPAYAGTVTGQGAEVMTGSPADFAGFVESESRRWGTVIKAAGIQAH